MDIHEGRCNFWKPGWVTTLRAITDGVRRVRGIQQKRTRTRKFVDNGTLYFYYSWPIVGYARDNVIRPFDTVVHVTEMRDDVAFVVVIHAPLFLPRKLFARNKTAVE